MPVAGMEHRSPRGVRQSIRQRAAWTATAALMVLCCLLVLTYRQTQQTTAPQRILTDASPAYKTQAAPQGISGREIPGSSRQLNHTTGLQTGSTTAIAFNAEDNSTTATTTTTTAMPIVDTFAGTAAPRSCDAPPADNPRLDRFERCPYDLTRAKSSTISSGGKGDSSSSKGHSDGASVPWLCEECAARCGLPNVFAKIRGQQGGLRRTLRIAYIGGSITASKAYRPQMTDMLRTRYPEAEWVEINAGIGGTASDLAVCRLRHDVIASEPDLVVVEFGVNDDGHRPEEVRRAMEGLVRQLWSDLPHCDVLFVYLVRESLLTEYDQGYFHLSISIHDQVARHYGIPSVHMALDVIRQSQQGKVVWRAPLSAIDTAKDGVIVFGPDGLHPHPTTGGRMYVEAVERCLRSIESVSSSGPSPHTLRSPLDPENWENMTMVTGPLELAPDVNPAPATDSRVSVWLESLPQRYLLRAPGDKVHLRFKGSYLGMYGVVGQWTGNLLVQIDEAKPYTLNTFSTFAYMDRRGYYVLGRGLGENIDHHLSLDVASGVIDKAAILRVHNRTFHTEFADRSDFILAGFCVVSAAR